MCRSRSCVPGTVKIAVAWCGICGTDLHEFLEGPIFTPPPGNPHVLSHEAAPVTLGHEFSGTVEELGEGVTGLAVGDSVVVEPYIVCNECGPCLSGHYNLCTKLGFIGLAGGGGGLSEKIVVDTRWVHPVGDIPLDEAALIEPLAVAYHAVGRSGRQSRGRRRRRRCRTHRPADRSGPQGHRRHHDRHRAVGRPQGQGGLVGGRGPRSRPELRRRQGAGAGADRRRGGRWRPLNAPA